MLTAFFVMLTPIFMHVPLICKSSDYHLRPYLLIIAAGLFFIFSGRVMANYTITINLLHTQSDKVQVIVESPELQQNYAIYRIPAAATQAGNHHLTVWLEDLAAYDRTGKHLKYELIDNNAIMIYEVNRYVKLTYKVKGENLLTGNKATLSHIQPQNNFFLLNRNGFFGFFEGYENEAVQVKVIKPPKLYGATNLERLPSYTDTLDVFTKPAADPLHENLILYALPDTFSFKTAGARFTIATFSETGAVKSRDLYYILKPVVMAVNNFLSLSGGKYHYHDVDLDTDTLQQPNELPVKEYTFLFYFTKQSRGENLNMSEYGGLMCSAAASFYTLPEIKFSPSLYRLVQRMVAHELMHLFLPQLLHTNLSARAVASQTQSTRHLWLYEGATEYFALLCLLRSKLIAEADFWEELEKKIEMEHAFEPMSMTDVSQNLFKKNKYSLWYPNFYHRGALAAFLLDLQLAYNSNNTFSLRQLLLKLSNKPLQAVYNDATLTDTLIARSHPAIARFFQDYIQGKKDLPYHAAAALLGLNYYPTLTEPFATFGQFWVVPNYKAKHMSFIRITNDRFGLQDGDLLLTMNDIPITIGNFQQHKHLIFRPAIGVPLTITIRRKKNNEVLTFSTNPWVTSKTVNFAFRQNPNAPPETLRRQKWLLYEE